MSSSSVFENFAAGLNSWLGSMNAILWHDYVLFTILGTGIFFLIATKFSPIVALTHGIQVLRGKFDKKDDPGAINHFQALSAALSATVGLGNIGGVAIAISLGGPGAVFWIWVVGLAGMALKSVEVTQTMLYRDTSNPMRPLGGPMYVASKGFEEMGMGRLGKIVGGIFCVTLIISAVTGGNMFQAWNVGGLAESYFGVPKIWTGISLALIAGIVIIGGIQKIGSFAGKLVPFMCGIYLVASIAILATKIDMIPELFVLIFKSAFSPSEAQGAFLGGSVGYIFLLGMKRALFSNEAGQGSAPIAHAAARTDEPVREGIVAGMEPFIDTIVVCTITALVILSSGAWNRAPESFLSNAPQEVSRRVSTSDASMTNIDYAPSVLVGKRKVGDLEKSWRRGQTVFTVVSAGNNADTGNNLHRLHGEVIENPDGTFAAKWDTFSVKADQMIDFSEKSGVFVNYPGATLTSLAFDLTFDGLGAWIITLASFLFAISTIISWGYYGEQGAVYLFGERSVLPYKLLFLCCTVISCAGLVTRDTELDNLTGFGTGVMLFANIPLMWIFARKGLSAYHEYVRKWKAGAFD